MLTRRDRDRVKEHVVPGRCTCCGHKLVQWTPERIAEAFQTHVATHGRVPTAVDWSAGTADHPASTTVCTMFGSWNRGVAAAGLGERARMEREPVWTRPMIVAALLDHLAVNGSWPTWRDWAKAKGRRNRSRPASWSVVREFGSWKAAILFASGVTDPDVATEFRAVSSARRLAAVEPSLTTTAPARGGALQATQTAAREAA